MSNRDLFGKENTDWDTYEPEDYPGGDLETYDPSQRTCTHKGDQTCTFERVVGHKQSSYSTSSDLCPECGHQSLE